MASTAQQGLPRERPEAAGVPTEVGTERRRPTGIGPEGLQRWPARIQPELAEPTAGAGAPAGFTLPLPAEKSKREPRSQPARSAGHHINRAPKNGPEKKNF